MPDREKVISKLEKEMQRTYSTKTTVFQNGKKVSEEINTHREPCVRIPIEMADKILALLKEQGEQIKNRDESLEKAREEIKWLREMLKEQEGVKPDYDPTTMTYSCGNCGQPFDRCKYKFCSRCGRKVKWE